MSRLHHWKSKAGRSMLAWFTAILMLVLAFAVPADESLQVGRLVPGIHTRSLRACRSRTTVKRLLRSSWCFTAVVVIRTG